MCTCAHAKTYGQICNSALLRAHTHARMRNRQRAHMQSLEECKQVRTKDHAFNENISEIMRTSPHAYVHDTNAPKKIHTHNVPFMGTLVHAHIPYHAFSSTNATCACSTRNITHHASRIMHHTLTVCIAHHASCIAHDS